MTTPKAELAAVAKLLSIAIGAVGEMDFEDPVAALRPALELADAVKETVDADPSIARGVIFSLAFMGGVLARESGWDTRI